MKIWRKRLFAVIVATGLIAFWRGIWGLMDLYLFPAEPALSYTVSVLLGLGILVVTRHAIKELL